MLQILMQTLSLVLLSTKTGDKVQITVVATGFNSSAKSVPEFGKTTTTRPASTSAPTSGIPDIPVFMKR